MNSYARANGVAAESWKILQPLIESRAYEGRYVVTAKGRLAKELQCSVGDLLFNSDAETVWGVELKAERRASRNFFLEVWSNRKTFRPGWMWTLNTDLLLYHFIEPDDLYCIDFRRLKQWFHGCDHLGRPPSSQYDYAIQSEYAQQNETVGALVRIAAVEEAIGFDLLHPVRGLIDTRHAVSRRYAQIDLIGEEIRQGARPPGDQFLDGVLT
jgi:hypothetical protein